MSINILVLATAILAVGDYEESIDGNQLVFQDSIWSKNVIDGYELITVSELPEDYAPGVYSWNGSAFILSSGEIAKRKEIHDASIKTQIAAIESSAPITARLQREQALIIRELIKKVTGAYPTSKAFTEAASMDAQIIALRSQL